MYELRSVRKVFGDGSVAVDDISLTIGHGEHVACIGPSGAGKTTLFRILNLTLRPTGGALVLDGREVAALSDAELRRARTRIGTIYQQQNLVGRLRVVPVDSTQPPMVLEGVYSPDQIAALIMHEVQQIRTGTGHDSSIKKV